jgi:hypothetical protein
MARGHGDGEQTAEVAAEQHSGRGKDSCAQVHIPLPPVFPQGAKPERRKKYQEGGALRGVLIHVQQVGQGGYEHDPAANAQQTDENAHGKAEEENDGEHHLLARALSGPPRNTFSYCPKKAPPDGTAEPVCGK